MLCEQIKCLGYLKKCFTFAFLLVQTERLFDYLNFRLNLFELFFN